MTNALKLTAEDLRRACPDLAGTVRLPGLNAPVDVYRDEYGIPHVKASGESDAFYAQGFVTAQDRLWQMEYDRRRGVGRWAEAVGPSGVEQDRLMRRCLLERSARADYEAVGAQTRAMLDAYAAGVNAFIATAERLPVEFGIAGISPEPWQPWDGLVVYKVRHLFMGPLRPRRCGPSWFRHWELKRPHRSFRDSSRDSCSSCRRRALPGRVGNRA